MVKISVLDDEPQDVATITRQIESCLIHARLDDFDVRGFTEEKAFLDDFAAEPANVAFLDIYLGKSPRGIEIAKNIRQHSPELIIIFLTNSPEFALEGFAVRAAHYCLKPVTEAGINECLRRIGRLIPLAQRGIRLQLIDGSEAFLRLADIIYAEAQGHHVALYMRTQEAPLILYGTLTMMEERFSSDGRFLRVGRSYLVNMDAITAMQGKAIGLTGGRELNFSRHLKDDIKEKYAAYAFRRAREW